MASTAVDVFFSYSHRDEALRDQLANHLKLLERQQIIASWHDRKILPGTEWSGDINASLNQADIILLLVSADFLASDYCWDVEIHKALARHEAGEATVIPVILRPVDWSSAPFAKLQALPKDAKPVVEWTPPDRAFMDIAAGIRRKAEELVAARQAQEAQALQQAARRQYRQRLKTYLADGEIGFVARENLRDLARSSGLIQTETEAIEAEETALREAYLANLDRYGQTFRRALEHETPLNDSTKTHLKDRQALLNLKDQDVQWIEASILAEWQAEQQRQKAQAAEERRRQEEEEAERIRQQQEVAEHQARERQAEQQRRQEWETAERRRQEEEEAERIRQQQEAAERRERERQKREAAEQLRREQAEAARMAAAERRKQARQRNAVEAARRAQRLKEMSEAAARGLTTLPSISRRQVLQIAGFGGGGLVVALVANSLSTRPVSHQTDASERPSTLATGSDEITFPAPPPVSGSSPDDLSPVAVQTVSVNERGGITEDNSDQVNAFREGLSKGVDLDMVQILAGDFDMGSPPEEPGRADVEGPQRKVTVSSFFMGRFPVTQAQYQAVMGDNPSEFKENGENRPVESVSWHGAVAFCEKLSELTGRNYRLPSEAEWEYACRAETTTPFYFGETITATVANYNGNFTYGSERKSVYRRETTEVGSFSPNAFGLYDMHGNVWEWCKDHWHKNYEDAPKDGTAWLSSDELFSRRIMRGGSWANDPRPCRSAYRSRYEPHLPQLPHRFSGVLFGPQGSLIGLSPFRPYSAFVLFSFPSLGDIC